ncbi:MAG: hypothetical protein K1Y02_22935, partial [Candidatus Hydrogenedentes bacterium]|nr:hypothetical protein [Candidatus Hydrogenedentota bacterium]
MTEDANPLVVAADWLGALTGYIDRHGLRGYDPFDVKQHALIRATQPYKWPRRATTLLCDVFPLATRRILRVATTENP